MPLRGTLEQNRQRGVAVIDLFVAVCSIAVTAMPSVDY